MDEETILEQSDLRQQEARGREHLWEMLEAAEEFPTHRLLQYLSGLLGEDIARLQALWPELALDVRRKLVHRLSRMAEADFEMDFQALFRLALEDIDPEVRATAIGGLHEVQDVRLVAQFARMLKEDEDVAVRAAAAEALGNFVLLGELRKIRERPFNLATGTLLAAYANPDEAAVVKRRAIEALAYTAECDVPELIAAAYASPDEEMRTSAVFAMGRSADQRWGDIAQEELRSPNPAMRFEATRACGELQLQEAIKELIELAEDVDPEIQQMALWALGQIGGRRARQALETYTSNPNEALRTAAEAALAELEFFHGDLSTFFGPPETFEGESELSWAEMDRLAALEDEDLEDEDEP